MSSAATKVDKLFWLAYCDAIKKELGTGFGKSTAMYFGTRSQRGPIAAERVAQEYTNAGIYNISDHLLPADNLFYAPSNVNSYIKSLMTYLGYVDLGGNPSNAQQTRLTNALEDMQSAQKATDIQLEAALAQYEKRREAGLLGDQTFPEWAVNGAPAYMAAESTYRAAASAYRMAMNEVHGAEAATYDSDWDRIHSAMYPSGGQPIAGLTMKCVSTPPASSREILNKIRQGQEVPPPPGGYLRPQYDCPEYQQTVVEWQNMVGHEVPTKSFTLNVSMGEHVDEHSFGQTSVSGGLSFSYVPWLSFGTSGSHSESDERFNGDDKAQDISITITYADMKKVTLSPGTWDIGDPKNTYPKLKPDAPPSARKLVRPSQLLLVSRLGFSVRFGASLATKFDQQVKKHTSGGGTLSLFGIPLGIGGRFDKSTENTTHKGTWDSASGTLTVEPTDDGGYATIVGMLGDIIDTA